MPLLRRFALLAVVAAGFGVLSTPAFAWYARDTSLPLQVDSLNFRVHYQSDHMAFATWAITQTQAGDIAARAERALAAQTADGYPRPMSDGALGGDGKIDIYVQDFSSFITAYVTPKAFAEWDQDNPTTSGFIELAGNLQEAAFTQHVIAHELFNLVQLSMWRPTQLTDYWLFVASAEWMGFRVDRYPAPAGLGPSDMSLDCRDPLGFPDAIDANPASNQCDLTADYLGNGDSRWPFFEYLSEKYGAGFLKDIFALGLPGTLSAVSALDNALQAKGTTLAAAYNAWQLAQLTSSYSVPALQAVRPTPYGAPIFTGAATTDKVFPGVAPNGNVPSQTVSVNHLSTRFLKFLRGPAIGQTTTSVCWKATLALKVAIPAGTFSQPVFYWDGPGNATVPLSINGSTATASIPWDTCTWASGEGFLSLPNASNGASPSSYVDAANFVVTASLTVDASTQVTSVVPAAPPAPVVIMSPVIPVSSLDVAPTIEVFGPQLLTLSATASQIRLIVSASGEGLVSAALGSLTLGTATLRAGNNDVRFTVPKGTLASVRRAAGPSNVLTLTPTATNGTATGLPVTRTISITPATKAPAKKAPAKKAPASKKQAKKTPAKTTKRTK
jgi:hypothetical protein